MRSFFRALAPPIVGTLVVQIFGRFVGPTAHGLPFVATFLILAWWAGWRVAGIATRRTRSLAVSAVAGPLMALPGVVALTLGYLLDPQSVSLHQGVLVPSGTSAPEATVLVAIAGSYLIIGVPVLGLASLVGGIVSLARKRRQTQG